MGLGQDDDRRGTDPAFWQETVRNLKGDRPGSLALAVLFVGFSLLGLGFSPAISIGFPTGVFLLYVVKGILDNRSKIKVAELSVRRLEINRGKPTLKRTTKALEKRERP